MPTLNIYQLLRGGAPLPSHWLSTPVSKQINKKYYNVILHSSHDLHLETRHVAMRKKLTSAATHITLNSCHSQTIAIQHFLPAALHVAQSAGIYVTHRAIFKFFAPQGQHVAPMRVKFGVFRSAPPRQISPPSVQRQGNKLKILLKFYQISEYKRPTGAYPLRDFHEICKVCT